MLRTIATLRPLWSKLTLALVVLIVVDVVALSLGADLLPGGPGWVVLVIGGLIVTYGLTAIGVPTRDRPPIALRAPVRGTWVALNSPGQQLPSHGTRTRGQFSAIDVCGTSDADSPKLVGFGLRGARPEAYACFGAEIHSMAAGTVVRASDAQRDHRARNTWQSLLAMMLVETFFRELGGTSRMLGNHVVVDHGDQTWAVYAHLRRGSAKVAAGDRVEVGTVLGEVGNTGNSSMPHLHVHLADRAAIDGAGGIPLVWTGIEFDGDLDEQLKPFAKEPKDSALAQMPRNAEVFTAV